MIHTGSKFNYQCTTCGREYPASDIVYLCPVCREQNKAGKPPAGVLKVLYDYEAIRNNNPGFQALKENGYLDILPINSTNSLPFLKTGNTPLYCLKEIKNAPLPCGLYLKDDSQNPTFSFKDRASAVVSAFAREKGFEAIVTASTGNAGSSLAGICASQNQRAVIIVPAGAPTAKLTQIIMYGATLVPVNGTYDDAFDLSITASTAFGWYNRNTAYNPLTIEGKKTVAFELYEQLGFQVPDRIFIPVGDGVILAGVYKGFEDLMKLGITEKMPILVAVQALGSDNLIRNLSNKTFEARPSDTLADSISVDVPRNFLMARDLLTKYQGEWLGVSDEQIMEAASSLAGTTGIFTEPASAAAYAGLQHYLEKEMLTDGTRNVVLLTGSGLKDIAACIETAQIPSPVNPDLESLKAFFR